jgi:hypothetical protein
MKHEMGCQRNTLGKVKLTYDFLVWKPEARRSLGRQDGSVEHVCSANEQLETNETFIYFVHHVEVKASLPSEKLNDWIFYTALNNSTTRPPTHEVRR